MTVAHVAVSGPSTPRVGLASGLVIALLLGLAVPTFAQVRIPTSWDRNGDQLTAGYRVYVGTAPGQPQMVIDTGQATNTVLTLSVGATYYMAVRAYTVHGTVGPASDESIIDLAAAPGDPRAMGAIVHGSTAVLSWAPPETGGAPLHYLLSVGTAPGAANLLNDFPVGNVLAISGNVPPGVYYARVRGVNLVGGGPRSSEVRFAVTPPPRPFSPVELSVEWSGTRATLTWARPPDAWGAEVPQYYVLEAGTAPGLSNIGSFSVGNTTSYVVDVPPGTYYVRLVGMGAGGRSEPSNEIVLRGRGAPGPAQALTGSFSGGVVTLMWAPPAGEPGQASSYVVEAGSAPGLSNLAVVNVGNVTVFRAAVPAGVYYVRVRSANSRGLGAPSNEVIIRP